MANDENRELLQRVNELLAKGMSLPQVADALDVNYNTLYSKIDRAGYEVEYTTTGALVPKKPAPELA